MISAEHRHGRSREVRDAVARLARVERLPVPRGARMSGVGRTGSIRRQCPAGAAAARRDGRADAGAARRDRRARAAQRACPTCIPTSPPCNSTCSARRGSIAWQEGKAAFLFARRRLLVGAAASLRALRHHGHRRADRRLDAHARARARRARRATRACRPPRSSFDVLMEPGAHAVLMRQVYNKTRTYLEWLAGRVGGDVTIVDDGDWRRSAAAIRRRPRSSSPRPSPIRWCARRTSTRLRAAIAEARTMRAGAAADHRLHDRDTVGVPHAAARSGRRHRARPAAPRRSAAPIAISGATSRPTTRSSPTR